MVGEPLFQIAKLSLESIEVPLHTLGDHLPDSQIELACEWLQDLRDAPDDDGPPLDAAPLPSLHHGLADIAASHVKSLRDYEF
jgi:hypothetical protein